MSTNKMQKEFPVGMEPIGKGQFKFACHSGVECFTRCCRDLNLTLYPYDILRLKKRLGISSEEFLNKYAGVGQGANPCFPSVVMVMADNAEKTCPFLNDEGCTVYEDRPSACRTYPLERAVDRNPGKGEEREFYFMTNHPYCKGHAENRDWTVKQWLRDQQLAYYNLMEELWTEMDTIFADSATWQGEGAAGPRQLMAFMVCYNLDRFREYMVEQDLLEHYKIDKARKRQIGVDDEALLRFGYDWLKNALLGLPTLKAKKR